MSADAQETVKQYSPRKVILPIIISLAAAVFIIWYSWDAERISRMGENWTYKTSLWIFAAGCMMAIRDLAYMYRIRLLTDWQIGFKRSFVVIMLWEFASAVTPSIVGGSAFALILLAREKIPAGKSTAIVLVTAFLDELFFILMAPLFLLFLGYSTMFSFDSELFGESMLLDYGINIVFWAGYFILFLYTAALAYGLFVNPHFIARIIMWLFRLPVLRKWKEGARHAADDLETASQELKGKNVLFWVKAFGSTVFSWTARYLVVNCIIAAFATGSVNQVIVYARQIVMWVIMLVTPTPGSSGSAEVGFQGFMEEFVPGLGGVLAFLWRLISYYPYLIIGVFLLPRWIQGAFRKKKGTAKP